MMMDKIHSDEFAHCQLMAKTLLEVSRDHPEALRWSLQGMGMFRLYLDPTVRLHVWDSEFAVEDVSTLHDHPWNFTSTVLFGSLEDRTFVEVEGKKPTHHKQKIICGEGGCALDDTRQDVRLVQARSERVKAGWQYSHKSTDIHESLPVDGTVTIIRREFLENTEEATVLFPLGTEWVSAEPRPATLMEIVSMSSRALQKIKGWSEAPEPQLEKMLEALKGYKMDAAEEREQAISFAVGNVLVDHPEWKQHEPYLRRHVGELYDKRHGQG